MKFINKSSKYLEVVLPKFKLNVNYSTRMNADDLYDLLKRDINKDSYFDLDNLFNSTKSLTFISAFLKTVSFAKEKLLYKSTIKINEEIKVYSNNKEKFQEIIEIVNAMKYSRDLQDMPQNILTPQSLKKILSNEFKDALTTPSKDHLKKMNLFNAVGVSSKNKQEFLIINHNEVKNQNPIVLIGKGITYDSGGYNIKLGKNLLGMKADMSGAAVVIGVMKLVKKYKLPKNIIALLPLAENNINELAMQPQMIFTALDGTSVEIKNTDAEGRLVNADAIAYANKYLNPSKIIEVSTLTGSITIMLSNLASGLFSNSQKFLKDFQKEANKGDERFVSFQRFPEVTKRLNNSSSIADIANIDDDTKMGSLFAFEFLNHFAKDTPFLHIDIAGTAVVKRDRGTAETLETIFKFVKNTM